MMLRYSWKQPCDMAIIAAQKYIYISKKFWISTNLTRCWKARKKEQTKWLPRTAAAAAFGDPAHMPDATEYILSLSGMRYRM